MPQGLHANKLAEIRNRAGLSARQAGCMMGVTEWVWNLFETGEFDCTEKFLHQFDILALTPWIRSLTDPQEDRILLLKPDDAGQGYTPRAHLAPRNYLGHVYKKDTNTVIVEHYVHDRRAEKNQIEKITFSNTEPNKHALGKFIKWEQALIDDPTAVLEGSV
ncbi:hypothetical protein [Aeromonas salmonicida]|uniref:hypothetical protein n=1 Tax=Aeromonas salmonicida TaxID=645 RepID=UPI000B4042A2|nr:hypothetical protein [Aeromonas salmonicida]ARW81569.1 hypothetical protein O23A_p0822 [Aeromonas salmonicida]